MNLKLVELHQLCLKLFNVDLRQRLETLAEFFFGVTYGAWQDGSSFESLDDFNYQLDLLDCVTYVEVVLALAKIQPSADYTTFVADFEKMLRKLHYVNGVPNFVSRNHFSCIDWIPNNKYMLEDITSSLTSTSKVAVATIDRPNWAVRHKINQPKSELSDHIKQLIPVQISSVPYIETKDILDNYANFVATIPEYSIVNIVRPNWDLQESIGTHLNISHLGFAFKNDASNELDFCHATIIQHKVTKEPLYSYLQRYIDSQTIRGINVLAVSPGYEHPVNPS